MAECATESASATATVTSGPTGNAAPVGEAPPPFPSPFKLPSEPGNYDNAAYRFFKSIGSPKRIVAPMVDQSELAYRMMTRRYGADLVYTQMFNSNAFIVAPEYREDNFTTIAEDRPLIVQFAGHDPAIMLQAAKMVEDKCDAVDINLGCPQGIARRGRYGAYLMEELDLLHEIVSTMVKGLSIPVTCKTRIYKDFDRSIRLCETLVNAGASLLVIHGRTRDEKGHHCGQADWDMLKRIKKHFEGRVPVIANGGIQCDDDVMQCIEVTGCDGVMTSEAVLENPALFTNNIDPSTGQRKTQIELAEEYLELCKTHNPRHIRAIRSHIMKFLFRYLCRHNDLRERIALAHSIEEFLELCQVCRETVGDQESSYRDTWYTRHLNPDVEINPKLRHEQKNPKYRRAKDNLMDVDDDWEQCPAATATASTSSHGDIESPTANEGAAIVDGSGMFGQLKGMFYEDE